MNRSFTYILALLCILWGSTAIQAQDVNISLTLKPPYSSNIKDYYHLENKAIIIVTNTSSNRLNIKIGGSITNQSRGVYIRTNKDFQPPMPLALAPFSTVTLTANPDLMNFFDQSGASTNANGDMLATIIRTGKLPEGDYEICLDAYDYNTGKQLSGRGNSCFNFTLQWLDPPVITFPQNNYSYPAAQVNKNFSWTPPIGNLAGSYFQYDQIVVKVQPGQNPNDAIAAARDFNAGNPVITKRNLPTQTYITQPFDLPFEDGATYAMQVIAKDRNDVAQLNNQGRSEIVVFSVGNGVRDNVAENYTNDNIPEFYARTHYTGTIKAYWPVSAGGGGPQSAYSGMINSGLKNVRVRLVLTWQVQDPEYIGGGTSFYLPGGVVPPHYGDAVTLDGINEVGVRTLATATTSNDGSFSFNVADAESINFGWRSGTLHVAGIGDMDVNHGGNVLSGVWTYQGHMRRALMVIVDDPYYCHPIQYKTAWPSNEDLGIFYSRIKTINTIVKVQDETTKAPKGGMDIFLMRKAGQRPSTVPKDELSPGNFAPNATKTIDGQNYEVLAKKTAASNGRVTFENLVFQNNGAYTTAVQGDNPYDRYYVYAEQEGTNFSLNPISPQGFFYNFESTYVLNTGMGPITSMTSIDTLRSRGNYSITGVGIGTANNNAYKVPENYYNVILTENAKPRLITTVRNTGAGVSNTTTNRVEANVSYYLYKINRAGMQQAKNALNDNWGYNVTMGGQAGFDMLAYLLGNKLTLETSGLTLADGKIDLKGLSSQWDLPDQIGYYRFLKIKKSGFDQRILPVKMTSINDVSGDMAFIADGETYQMNDINITPSGTLYVRLVNERGEPVAGKAYYTDPATGQNGTATSGQWMQENDGSYSYVIGPMAVPSGNNRKIVVYPTTNTNLYVRDTVSVNVPAEEQHTAKIVLKYKLHRIYFNVKSNEQGPLKNATVELMNVQNNAAVMYNDLESPWISSGTHSQMQNHPQMGLNDGAQTTNNGQPVPRVNENISNTTTDNPYVKKTNSGGGVDFAFRNAGPDQLFRITGPSGEISYVVINRSVNNTAGKNWQKEEVTLYPGRKVKGTVKLGSAPVAHARVQVINVEPGIEAMTDAEGKYEMDGVPAGIDLRFSASKQGYQGMEYDEANPAIQSVYGIAFYETHNIPVQVQSPQPQPNQPNLPLPPVEVTQTVTTINFKLRIYENLDLSRLLGFPLEVTNLKEIQSSKGALGKNSATPGKTPAIDNSVVVQISGLVTVSDSLNNIFKISNTNADGQKLSTIRFETIMVVADDVKNDSLKPYCRPQTLPVRTAINEQYIDVYNFYSATMRDDAGIALNKYGTGQQSQGIVQSKVTIDLTSFTDNNIGLPNGQGFYLARKEGNQTTTQFPVFASSGTALINAQDGVGLSNATGAAVNYTLHGFNAMANAANSKVYRDSMVLDTRLQTNLQYVPQPNLDLSIGSVVINSNRELVAIDKVINTTTTLGSFDIKWDRFKVNNGGVKLNGVLNAAGMTMPFANAELYPTQFQIADGSLAANNVKMLNVINVQVNAGASFGYDGGVGAWVLAIFGANKTFANPAAAFSTSQLQGFPANGNIPVASIYMYSNDTRDINLYNMGNYTYRLYDIANFTIDNILPTQEVLKMPGTLDLDIPAFPNYSTAVQYDKTNNGISGLNFQYFNMAPVAVNGVVMGFNPGNNTQAGNNSALTITPGKIVIKGTVSDEQPDIFNNIRTTLTRTSQRTELVIDEPAGGRQRMALGGANTQSRIVLSDIMGKMWVVNNAWNHLYVEGDMPADMGFTADGRHMRFEVKGALEVNNQQVKLKNISTPFGNINMQYDLANHRLFGGLQVNANAGGAAFSGSADMAIDRSGYYFLAGLQVSMSSPQLQGNAFMLIGDYATHTPLMDARLSQYSVMIQKKLEYTAPDMASTVMNLLSQDPEAGIQMMETALGSNYLPEAYTRLFGAGRFNGFYFNGGASIPLPIIPNFKLDLSPVASFEMGLNGGIDVRFGANFDAQDTYTMGFNVFLDAAFGGGGSAVVICVYGRIGLLISFGIDGYMSGGNYSATCNADLFLTGLLRVGGGACAMPCDGITCLNVECSGSLHFGAAGTVSNNGNDLKIFLKTEGGVSNTVHEPPPPPNNNN